MTDQENQEIEISRRDRYNVVINDFVVRATPDQESRIRDLAPEQLANFRKIMGG